MENTTPTTTATAKTFAELWAVLSYEAQEEFCLNHTEIGWCRVWLAKHGEAYD